MSPPPWILCLPLGGPTPALILPLMPRFRFKISGGGCPEGGSCKVPQMVATRRSRSDACGTSGWAPSPCETHLWTSCFQRIDARFHLGKIGSGAIVAAGGETASACTRGSGAGGAGQCTAAAPRASRIPVPKHGRRMAARGRASLLRAARWSKSPEKKNSKICQMLLLGESIPCPTRRSRSGCLWHKWLGTFSV